MSSVIKIISGGQTGADRAALDWALAHGVEHGGWCPKERRAEDGRIDEHYRLSETPSLQYRQRTIWNVRDSDATVIFSLSERLSGGSRLTLEAAGKLGKPCLHLYPGADVVTSLRDFLARYDVRTLNVAGPRASRAPNIVRFVQAALSSAILRIV